MLNKDVTRIVQSLSRVRRNLTIERKALLRWQSPSLQWLTFVQNFSRSIAMITAFRHKRQKMPVFWALYQNNNPEPIQFIYMIYTAISRKVVAKRVHATIPKGNMGYDHCTVPNDCSCRNYFFCFPLALANICPWPLVPFFQISL